MTTTATAKTTTRGGYVYTGDTLIGRVREVHKGSWYAVPRDTDGNAASRYYGATRAQVVAQLVAHAERAA